MDPVKAGDLRSLVALHRPVYTTDDAGASVATYSSTATDRVWAKVDSLSDSMSALAAQAFGAISHRVTIRYYSGIDSGWQVRMGSRILHVVGPPRDIEERHVYMELRCSETEVVV